MFSRNEKLALAALAFCVFVTGAIIPLGANWLMLGANQSEKHHTEYYHRKCETQDTIGLPAIDNAIGHSSRGDLNGELHKSETRNTANYSDYCDLAAQYMAARSAQASSYWAALTFAATAVGVLLLWYTLRETRAVTITTREIGQKQVRAYLSAEPESAWVHDFPWVKKVVHVGGKVTIKNHGASPARNIRCIVTYFFNGKPVGPLSGNNEQILVVGDTLTPKSSDSAHPSCMLEINEESITVLNLASTSLFEMQVLVTYCDVFSDAEVHSESSVYYLFNGNSAALSAHSQSLIPKKVEVEWKRYDLKYRTQTIRPPISARDLFS